MSARIYQPTPAIRLHAADFPPAARVADISRRLNALGWTLRCVSGAIYAVRLQ